MNKIQKVSFYFVKVCNVLLILIPIIVTAIWFLPESVSLAGYLQKQALLNLSLTNDTTVILDGSNTELIFLQKFLGFCGSIVSMASSYASLFFLRKIFINYENSSIFSLENARYYQKLGIYFFIDALIGKPAAEALFVLGATISNEVGNRVFSLSFGSRNLEVLFYGVIVLIISWVMIEASKLQEEHNSTI